MPPKKSEQQTKKEEERKTRRRSIRLEIKASESDVQINPELPVESSSPKEKESPEVEAPHVENAEEEPEVKGPTKEDMDPCWVPALSTPAQLVELMKDANCTIAVPQRNVNKRTQRWTQSNLPLPVLTRYLAKHANPVEAASSGGSSGDKRMKSKPAGGMTSSEVNVEYIEGLKITKNELRYRAKLAGKPSYKSEWHPFQSFDPEVVETFMLDYAGQLTEHIHSKGLTWDKVLEEERPTKVGVYEWLLLSAPSDFVYKSSYKKKKIKQRIELRRIEDELNETLTMQPCIRVDNEVDLEILPINFEPIDLCVPGKDIVFPTGQFRIHCKCEKGCEVGLREGKCCPMIHGVPYMYNEDEELLESRRRAIYECNEECGCTMACPNRIVQKGRVFPISVFRTSDGRGWGVKTLEKIPKGSFVMEYVGEVITNEEAEERGKKYDDHGMTYLFDLDFHDSSKPLSIDATNYGNMSRFINHSCAPNMVVYNVWIEFCDPAMPRLAFFASRDIKMGGELTIDYNMSMVVEENSSGDPTEEDEVPPEVAEKNKCRCGSARCRGVLISKQKK